MHDVFRQKQNVIINLELLIVIKVCWVYFLRNKQNMIPSNQYEIGSAIQRKRFYKSYHRLFQASIIKDLYSSVLKINWITQY